MNDPRRFKAPFISKERIWQEADKLRSAHRAGQSLPVQVLDMAEFDLGLDLIPAAGLREELDIEALLMGDLSSILIDRHAFMTPRLEYPLRFSIAQEIGHLILHGEIYRGFQHVTAKEWFDYISAIPDVEYGWVEWQAYEFAGRLLVPSDALRDSYQAAIQTAKAAGYEKWLSADEAALDYIATRIAPKFGVSADVIAKRLRVEKL